MSKQKYPQATSVSSTGTTVNKNATKRKQNGYSNFTLHAKRNRKRQEAEERQAAYDKLSLAEKMKHAGKKELAKLQKRHESVLTATNAEITKVETGNVAVKVATPKKTKKVAKK